MRTAAAAVAALVVTLSASPEAHAQRGLSGTEGHWAKSMTSRAAFGFDILNRLRSRGLTEEQPRHLLQIISFGSQFEFTKGYHLDMEIPVILGYAPLLRYGQTTPDTRQELVAANLTVGGHAARELSPWLVAYVGGSVSLPLTWWPDARDLEISDISLLARAFFDTHRTFLNHLPLRARGGLEMEFEEIVQIRSDLTASLALSLSSDSSELVIEQGNELQVGYQGVGIGLRVQEAFLLTEPDKAQVALEPFFNLDPVEFTMFVRVGVLFAIDQPMGFGLGKYGIYTVTINSGIEL
ncbi:hypothetical protein [Sorangium sp. So ce1335]|uniref:hypothetical protein n=1 Tax=Sorangium sp. So ce1335 TaxID=3133335 RepID=UPI003F609D87